MTAPPYVARSQVFDWRRELTEAPDQAPHDCGAYARSPLLYERTTAISPRYAVPFRLCTRLQRPRSSSDTHSAYRSLESHLSTLYYALQKDKDVVNWARD
jgi:hypothetical protein